MSKYKSPGSKMKNDIDLLYYKSSCTHSDNCIYHFSAKSLKRFMKSYVLVFYHIWHCHKKITVNPMSFLNNRGSSRALIATYQGSRPSVSWFWRRFLKFCYRMWDRRQSWSCYQNYLNKFLFPQSLEATHGIWLQSAQWLQKRSGRTTEPAYSISCPEAFGSGELNIRKSELNACANM